MRRLALIALLGGCTGVPVGAERAAIVGGAADPGDPAVVAIGAFPPGCAQPFQVRCSGAVVAPRVVLTAAHCFAGPPEGERVYLGARVGAGGAFRQVVSVMAHPDFDDRDNAHDLALVLLDGDAGVAPLAAGPPPAAGDTVRVVGFGEDGTGAASLGEKRSGTSIVTSAEPRRFRTGPGPALSCAADSGGPVLAGDRIVGVTSSGDPRCREDADNVAVEPYLDGFIRPGLEALAGEPPPAPRTAGASGLCARACTSDADCPDGLACVMPGAPGGCAPRGLLPGELGAACTGDDACGGGLCARLDADRCACYRACGPATPEARDGGGCAAGQGARGAPWLGIGWLISSWARRSSRRSRSSTRRHTRS